MKGTYRKDELLAIIRANRETHLEVLRAALDGYRAEAMKVLNGTLGQIRDGRAPELRILLARPENHAKDYDRIIRMLEMEVQHDVTLDEGQFAHYVMDDWDWKRNWVLRNSSYAAAETARAYGDPEDEG